MRAESQTHPVLPRTSRLLFQLPEAQPVSGTLLVFRWFSIDRPLERGGSLLEPSLEANNETDWPKVGST